MAKFTYGNKANPAGRPKGTSARQQLFDKLVLPRAPELINKCVDDALMGDASMMKILVDRILPRLPAQSFVELKIDLNKCDTIDGIKSYQRYIFTELAHGRLCTQDLVSINETLRIAQDTLLADDMRNKLELKTADR